MSEPDATEDPKPAPNGKSEAQIFLESEFSRCRKALVSFEGGADAMKDGQGKFDALWAETVRNAGRLFGRVSTRDALEHMGRAEYVRYMY